MAWVISVGFSFRHSAFEAYLKLFEFSFQELILLHRDILGNITHWKEAIPFL